MADTPRDPPLDLARIREEVQRLLGFRGDGLDQAVTYRTLVDQGWAEFDFGRPRRARGTLTPPPAAPGDTTGGGTEPDLTPPPDVTGLSATAGFTRVVVQWDPAVYTQGHGHGQTNIYAAIRPNPDPDPAPTFADAVRVSTAPNPLSILAIASEMNARWHLWAKHQTADGVESLNPAGGINGVQVTTGQDITQLLTLLTGQITESHLFSSLGDRINLIDGPASLANSVAARILAETNARIAAIDSETAARISADNVLTASVNNNAALIASETSARASGDSAEAAARQVLAAQLRGEYTGTDVTQLTTGLIYNERIARASADETIATQIALLSAGSSDQFDYKKIWYFDTGVESWTGNGTPTASGGFLKPAAHASDPYVESPVGIDAPGGTYPQVRMRIRKTGTPTWDGFLWWRTTADSTWDASRRVVIGEPSYDGNGIGLVTVNPLWSVTIDRIRIDLSSSSDGSNYFELDWVAVGRPSPGASSAALFEEQTARASADSALSASITSLTATVDTNTADIASETSARASADAATTTLITQLQSRVQDDTGFAVRSHWGFDTTAEGWAATNATISVLDGILTFSPSADGADLSRALAGAERFTGNNRTLVRARVRRITGSGTWEGHCYYSTSAHSFSSSFRKQIAAPADQTAWNVLEWDMAALTVGGADYKDNEITGLRIDLVADGISSWEVDWIAAGQPSNTPLTAAIQTEATTRATETGSLFAQYTVKVDLNGYVSGFGLASTANNATPTSSFVVRADKFAISSPSGPGITPVIPFIVNTTPQVENGVSIPPGVYMDGAYIRNLSAAVARLGDAWIDNADIANVSAAKLTAGSIAVGAHIQSQNYVPGSAGWRVGGDGAAEFSFAHIRGLLSAAQIDTRGLTVKDLAGNVILASGTPLAEAYAGFGLGVNLLYNADFSNGLDGWDYSLGQFISPTASGLNLDPNWYLSPYTGAGTSVFWTRQVGRSGAPDAFYEYVGRAVPVVSGARYVISAYTGAHRCTVSVFFYHYRADGTLTGWSWNAGAGTSANNAEAVGGYALSGYKRVYDWKDVPSDVAFIRPVLRKYDTIAGQADSYGFIAQVQIERVSTGTTTPGPWTPSGMTDMTAVRAINPITAGNVSTYIANAAIGNAQIGGFIQSDNYVAGSQGWRIAKSGAAEFSNVVARGSITANAVSAASGTLGTITAGFLRNAANTSFVNLNATGSQNFLSANNGSVRITADGDAFFTKVLASGTWSGTIDLVDGAEKTILVDTGFNKPWSVLFERTMSARIGGFTGNVAPGRNEPGGSYTGAFDVSVEAFIRKPAFIVPYTERGQNPFGAGNERVFLRIRLKLVDADGYGLWTLTSLQWTLDAVG